MAAICKSCADKQGLILKDKAVGMWFGKCDSCKYNCHVVGRRDYRKPGQKPVTLEDVLLYEATHGRRETTDA